MTNVHKALTYTTETPPIAVYADKNTDTGRPLERSFCSVCGSPIALRTNLQPGRVMIPSGVLDGNGVQDPVPQEENFLGDRVGWMGDVGGK